MLPEEAPFAAVLLNDSITSIREAPPVCFRVGLISAVEGNPTCLAVVRSSITCDRASGDSVPWSRHLVQPPAATYIPLGVTRPGGLRTASAVAAFERLRLVFLQIVAKHENVGLGRLLFSDLPVLGFQY